MCHVEVRPFLVDRIHPPGSTARMHLRRVCNCVYRLEPAAEMARHLLVLGLAPFQDCRNRGEIAQSSVHIRRCERPAIVRGVERVLLEPEDNNRRSRVIGILDEFTKDETAMIFVLCPRNLDSLLDEVKEIERYFLLGALGTCPVASLGGFDLPSDWELPATPRAPHRFRHPTYS